MKHKRLFFMMLLFSAVLLVPATVFSAGEDVPDLERAEDYSGDLPIRIVKKIDLSEGYHEGVYHDGTHIWVCNGKGGDIWVIDPGNGEVVSDIVPLGKFTEGITPAGDGTFWVTDWDDKKLYRTDIDGGRMSLEYEISLEPAHPAGLVWTGTELYVITWTRSMMGTAYHLMQLDGNEKLFRKLRFKRIHEPAHLAWDGKYLWVTSWYNRLVYKIDIKTFNVVSSFRSPAPDTTGIAWDGEYFWITGSHADLYKVEILDE